MNSYAGFEKRNGGDGVYCRMPDKPEHLLRTLDYYESQMGLGPQTSIIYNIVPFDADTDNILKTNIYFTKKSYPSIFNHLHVDGALFFYRNLNLIGMPLEDVEDSNEVFYFSQIQQCRRVQLAVNKIPLFKGQKIFTANILYGDLSAVDQHRLIIHELLSFCSDSETSEDIRYLTNLIFSDDLKKYTEYELDDLFRKVGIKHGLYNFNRCYDKYSRD